VSSKHMRPKCPRCSDSRIVVSHRRHNHSVFRGRFGTASRYSEVVCTFCGWRWRTRAEYVDHLPDEDASHD